MWMQHNMLQRPQAKCSSNRSQSSSSACPLSTTCGRSNATRRRASPARMVPHHQLRVEGAVVATSASMTATTTLTYVEDHVQDAMARRPSPAGSSSSRPSGHTGPMTPGGSSSSSNSGSRGAAGQQQGAPGGVPAFAQRWRLLSSTPLAGGELHVVQWEGPRNIRVWLPPGYSKEEGQKQPWPVLYCNDGQNVFGDCETLSGTSWGVAHTAAGLISSGKLPPFLVVGLDHAGPLRSLEYTPYTPGTGPGGFRCDAAQWLGGGVAAYLARLQQEVLPWVAGQYAASLQPRDLAFAGSSFGGVAALSAGMMSAHTEQGCAFGALLVESPSMWIAEEALLKDIRAFRGPWPQRVYVGMGGKEYSGVRGGRGREHDAYFPRYLKALYAALTEQGLGPDRLAWSYDPRATHNESAWAARLPDALGFIGQGWWASWLQRQAASGRRLLASAPQLCAGVEGQLLFFNRSASPALAHLPRGSGLKVTLGVDGWQGAQQLQLEPLGAAGPHHHVEPPAALQQEVFEAWGLDPSLQQTLHKRLLDSVRGTGSSSSSGPAPDDWYVLQLPPPPAGCHQLDMAFCDADEKSWDNNDGQDFHLQVNSQPQHGLDHHHHQQQHHQQHDMATVSRATAMSSRGGGTVALAALHLSTSQAAAMTTPAQSFGTRAAAAEGPAAAVLRMLDALRLCAIGDGCGFISADALGRAEQAVLNGANAPAQEAAAEAEAAGQLTFAMPQQPVAGLPVSLYVNKAQLQDALKRAPSMCLQVGFNDWSTGVQKIAFRPSTLRRNDRNDWWCCRVHVPEEAHHGAYAICGVFNGSEVWDNNMGANYGLSVMCLEAAVVRAVAAACMGLDLGVAADDHSIPADSQPTPKLVFA